MAVERDSSGINTAPFPSGVAMDSDFEKLKRTLSMNLKRYRAERGISQERLALEAGVDRTVVSRLERCLINPTLVVLMKLAIRLEVSVDLLIKNQDTNSKAEP
jgi:transcriptional regulator with XRE-family HTH domain